MKNYSDYLLRTFTRLGVAFVTILSFVALLAFPSPASAAPGDSWTITGKASGDQLGGTAINGYGISSGMGIFQLQNDATGAADYAFCIDPATGHVDPGNIEKVANSFNSPHLDYLTWQYAKAGIPDDQAIAAQGLAWYYVDGARSDGTKLWWDTLNNNAVTPFSPDPWNALPTFGWAAPAQPVGFQSVSPYSEDQVEAVLYNIAVEVEQRRGPWVATDTGTPNELHVSGPGHPTFNPSGNIEGATVRWLDANGNTITTSTTNAAGIATDPTGTAVTGRVLAPGTHREAQNGTSQLLALSAPTVFLDVTVAVPVSEPVVTTQISSTSSEANQVLSDSIILSGMQPNQTATVQLQLFNLTNDPSGSGAPLVDQTVTGLTNGTHSGLASYMITFADAGDTLGYRERILSTTDGAPPTGWSDLGVAAETTVVALSNPAVVTNISTSLALANSTVSDSVTLSGLVGGATADVQLQLFDLNLDATGSGVPLVDVTISDLSNGTHTGLAPYMVTFADAGHTLGYRERVVATSDGQSTNWSALGIASETTPVDISEPVVVTQISTDLGVANSSISDSLTLSGLVGGATADIQIQLFNLTHDPAGIGTPLVDVTLTGLDNGTYTGIGSYDVTFDDAGDYLGYRERILSTSDGLSTSWSALGAAPETTEVDISEPVVVTQISTDLGVANSSISDSLTLSGLVGNARASVQIQLFNLTHDPFGEGQPLVDVTLVNLDNGTYNGLATYMLSFEDAGDMMGYRERIVSTSDGVSKPWSALGIANESTMVDISEPVVITNISDQNVFAGETITDSLTVSGLVGGALADIQLQLFNLTHDPSGSGVPLVDLTFENLDNGDYIDLGAYLVTLNDEGDQLGYRERVVTTSDAVTTEWSDLGIASETTAVYHQPQVITNASATFVEPGDTVFDVVSVRDIATAVSEEITIQVSLYDLSLDPTCSSLPLTTVLVPATADGDLSGIAPYVVLESQRGHVLGYVESIVSSTEPLRIFDGEWSPSVCGALSESFSVAPALSLDTQASFTEDYVVIDGLYPEHVNEVMTFDANGDPQASLVTIPQETVTLTATLHGPFESLSAAALECSTESVVETIVTSGLPAGGHVIDFTDVTEYGVYTFEAHFTSDTIASRSTGHGCGLAAESFVYNPDLMLSTYTDAYAYIGDGPAEVVDSVDISGVGINLDGSHAAWSADVALYGPFTSLASASCTSETLVGTPMTVTGFGSTEFLSPSFTVESSGLYTFSAQVTREVDGQTIDHPCGILEESLIAFDAIATAITTSEVLIGVGEPIHGAVTVSDAGIDFDGSGQDWGLEVQVFGPYDSLEAATCNVSDVVESYITTGNADDTISTPDMTFDEPGIYTMVSSVFRPLDGNESATECGEISSAFSVVDDPSLATEASHDFALPGSEVHDALSLNGIGTLPDGTPLSWAASTSLYGPYDSLLTATCAAEDLIDSKTFTGTGDGSFISPSFTVPSTPGIYTFVTEVSRSEDNGFATHDCAMEVESFEVLTSPEVATQTVNAWVLVEGATLQIPADMEVTGMGEGNDWSGTLSLYGPFESDAAATCSTTSLVETVAVSGTGDGVFQVTGFPVSTGGVYTFVPVLERHSDGAEVSHNCAVAPATLEVTVEMVELPATGPFNSTRTALVAFLAALGSLILIWDRRRSADR